MHQCIKCIIYVTVLFDVIMVHIYDYLPGDYISLAYFCSFLIHLPVEYTAALYYN